MIEIKVIPERPLPPKVEFTIGSDKFSADFTGNTVHIVRYPETGIFATHFNSIGIPKEAFKPFVEAIIREAKL